ncbi:unnamed protein product [Diplocarpon coronariae]
MLNLSEYYILFEQLHNPKALELLGAQVYENCSRLVLANGNGTCNYGQMGDMTRANPRWVERKGDDQDGRWAEGKLIKKIGLVKLIRGSEKRLKGRAKERFWRKRDEARARLFQEAKEEREATYQAGFAADFDEAWMAGIRKWAVEIPRWGDAAAAEDVVESYRGRRKRSVVPG